MPSNFLHIIAFNIPYPANYGGVIDIYYKIVALKQAGIQIILHCFEYGRQHAKELEELCFQVHYYPRKSGLKYFFSSKPYIVTTRSAKSMPINLLGDSFPVLFEGLHSTGLMENCSQASKKILIRTHNIEHRYYRALSKSESNLYRKAFLRTESFKLKGYERILKQADHILGISKHETDYFNDHYGNAVFVPPFHRFDEVNCLPGTGDYILFHGNLGVPENSAEFLKLAEKVLSGIAHTVIVSGKNPSERFKKKISRHPHIKLVADPTDQELHDLIQHAQINLLHTSQATGIKLKLIHALYSGRHCLVNSRMIKGTGLDPLCTRADTPEALQQSIGSLMVTPFSETEIRNRRKALKDYSNRANAEKILRLLG